MQKSRSITCLPNKLFLREQPMQMGAKRSQSLNTMTMIPDEHKMCTMSRDTIHFITKIAHRKTLTDS